MSRIRLWLKQCKPYLNPVKPVYVCKVVIKCKVPFYTDTSVILLLLLAFLVLAHLTSPRQNPRGL